MNQITIAAGDALADKLIAEYWLAFEAGTTWNYHSWLPKYVKNDAWATRANWLDVSRRALETKVYHRPALEVLLAEGCLEYASTARKLVHDWHRESGHDAYYFYDLMAHFPRSDKVRRVYFSKNLRATDLDKSARIALFSVEDVALCRHVSQAISDVLLTDSIDEDLAESYVLPRLAEMGPLCSKYIDAKTIDAAKKFCISYLKKDEAECLMPAPDDERSLWIRDEIAYLSWRLGWTDILRGLEKAPWYWTSVLNDVNDNENYNLLTWSLLKSNEQLKNRALCVMQTHEYHKLDGAIAWKRLHSDMHR
jgi:hypothetical protein